MSTASKKHDDNNNDGDDGGRRVKCRTIRVSDMATIIVLVLVMRLRL